MTDEATRITVKNRAYGTLSTSVPSAQISAPWTDRIVKYIANRAAKNMSSELSHTIVPTATMFGRVRDPCGGSFSRAGAAVTRSIMAGAGRHLPRGAARRAGPPAGAYPGRVLSGPLQAPTAVLAHADGLPPFTVGVLFSQAVPALLPLLLVLVPALAYLYGVRRLTARGDAWPVGRTLSFLVGGLGTIAVATMSGLAAYDTSLFAAHMVQHMLLSMVATVFLALGAPITLALRTLPRRPRRALLALLHSRFARVVSFPLIPWALFVASPFALYFSGWYEATLGDRAAARAAAPALPRGRGAVLLAAARHRPGARPGEPPVPDPARGQHAAVPRLPRRLDHERGARRARPDRRRPLPAAATAWPSRSFQQQLGGGLLWASGDIIGLLFLGVLLTQWMRASEREAQREDRRLDRLDAAGAAEPAPDSSSASAPA